MFCSFYPFPFHINDKFAEFDEDTRATWHKNHIILGSHDTRVTRHEGHMTRESHDTWSTNWEEGHMRRGSSDTRVTWHESHMARGSNGTRSTNWHEGHMTRGSHDTRVTWNEKHKLTRGSHDTGFTFFTLFNRQPFHVERYFRWRQFQVAPQITPGGTFRLVSGYLWYIQNSADLAGMLNPPQMYKCGCNGKYIKSCLDAHTSKYKSYAI